jgi:hypothetical protein
MGMLLSSYKRREMCQFTLSLSGLHSVYIITGRLNSPSIHGCCKQ